MLGHDALGEQALGGVTILEVVPAVVQSRMRAYAVSSAVAGRSAVSTMTVTSYAVPTLRVR